MAEDKSASLLTLRKDDVKTWATVVIYGLAFYFLLWGHEYVNNDPHVTVPVAITIITLFASTAASGKRGYEKADRILIKWCKWAFWVTISSLTISVMQTL